MSESDGELWSPFSTARDASSRAVELVDGVQRPAAACSARVDHAVRCNRRGRERPLRRKLPDPELRAGRGVECAQQSVEVHDEDLPGVVCRSGELVRARIVCDQSDVPVGLVERVEVAAVRRRRRDCHEYLALCDHRIRGSGSRRSAVQRRANGGLSAASVWTPSCAAIDLVGDRLAGHDRRHDEGGRARQRATRRLHGDRPARRAGGKACRDRGVGVDGEGRAGPLTLTAVAPVKPLPRITMDVPGEPLAGTKEASSGGGGVCVVVEPSSSRSSSGSVMSS